MKTTQASTKTLASPARTLPEASPLQVLSPSAAGQSANLVSKSSQPIEGEGPNQPSTVAEQLLAALKALRLGDFDVRLAGAWSGVSAQIADAFNELAEMLAQSNEELRRINRVVGKEGRLHESDVNRFIELDARGEVAALKDNINQMIRNLRETTLKLEQRVASLTDINRELEAFSYSVSHDLRAPLRSMSGFAQALLDQQGSRLDPEALDYANRIRRSTQYMDVLLQDLLAYSRLARAEMPLAPVDLDNLVRQVLVLFENDLRKSAGAVELVSPLGLAMAHETTLKQIVSNLIDNAIKFAAPERPLRLRIFRTSSPGFIRIWIEDNGIGVASAHHEKIFGLFQRLHSQEKYPGTGVGLALVRKAAERMGGWAGLESEPGQGSRFWFELPVDASLAEAH